MCITRRGTPQLPSTQRMDLSQQNTWSVFVKNVQEDISMVSTLIDDDSCADDNRTFKYYKEDGLESQILITTRKTGFSVKFLYEIALDMLLNWLQNI